MVFTIDNKFSVNGGKNQYHQYCKKALTEYCDEHSQNSRFHFSKKAYAQMVENADCPEGYQTPDEIMDGDQEYFPISESMKTLVELVRNHSQQT